MHEKYRKTEVNSSKQQKTTGGAPLTVQKICAKQHIRQENHILKARAGLEGFKRAREGFEFIYNTNKSITEIFIHTGEKTIEVQTREVKTTEGTPHTVQKICTKQHTRQENHILKARVGFEGSKRAGEGSKDNYNSIILILVLSIQSNILEKKTIEVQNHTGVISNII